ncbi:membrane protein FxsA [bacterium]|nr:membrane protein FxsA [candidate division CSSED10-310 bacterium]
MFRYLLLLFVGIPLIELFLLLKIGELMGAEVTILLVLLTGISGAYLARHQGSSTWNKIQIELSEGRIPGDRLLDGLMIFAGGILLLTPGFLTDLLGLSLLIPPTRTPIKKWLKRKFQNRIDGQVNFKGWS